MLRNVPVSRKSFIASAVALCSIAISPKQSKAQPLEVEFPFCLKSTLKLSMSPAQDGRHTH